MMRWLENSRVMDPPVPRESRSVWEKLGTCGLAVPLGRRVRARDDALNRHDAVVMAAAPADFRGSHCPRPSSPTTL